MIIYKIINNVNCKVYIGQTTQSLNERLWQHSHRSPSQSHKSLIYNAIKKYGIESFTIEILAIASSLAQLNQLEIEHIITYNSIAPHGYNLLKGGDNRECHSDTKIKISSSLKGRTIKNRMNGAPKGRRVSEARKARISATMKGKPQPWKYKPIIAIEIGMIYESINVAAKALKVNRVTISGLLKSGKQGRLGLTFKYITKE